MLVFVVGLGVNGNGSLASLDVIVSGLELMIASTSYFKVSSLNRFPCSRSKVSRIPRVVLICLSQTPPM